MIETSPDAVNLLQTNDQYDNTPLHLAAEKGQESIVQLFLEEQYVVDIDNKNEDERAPCHMAAKNGENFLLLWCLIKYRYLHICQVTLRY